MRSRCLSIIALVVVCSVVVMRSVVAEDARHASTVRIKVVDDLQKARPVFEATVTLADKSLHFEKTVVDTRIIGSLGDLRNGQRPLAIMIAMGGKVGTNDVPATDDYQHAIDVRSLMMAGVPQHIDCGGGRWLELQVD